VSLDARLERRRNSEAVCATCRHWAARDEQRMIHSAMCEPKQMVTLDLAVCAGWERHEVLTGKIIEPTGVTDGP